MDLLNKIIDIIKTKIDSTALFDLTYDDQDNISGYVATDILLKIGEKKLNDNIWKVIDERLTKKEKLKILAIFTESFSDRIKRIQINDIISSTIVFTNKCFIHRSKDDSKYYAFIDVARVGPEYKTFYLVINERHNFRKGLIFNYSRDVIEFMESNGTDLYKELYGNVYEGFKTTIKIKIMSLYEEKSTMNNLYGNQNIYSYVYDSFIVEPIIIGVNTFIQKEIQMIKDGFMNIFDCSVKSDIEKVLNMSRNIISEELL